jgi:hypothetical protein
LLNEISNRRAEAGVPISDMAKLAEAIKVLQAELHKTPPETSLVREGLITVTEYWRKRLAAFLQAIGCLFLQFIQKALS